MRERKIFDRFKLIENNIGTCKQIIDYIIANNLSRFDVEELIYEVLCQNFSAEIDLKDKLPINSRGIVIDQLRESQFVEGFVNKGIKDHIAYYAGYYDHDTRVRIEKLLNHPHPILGWADKSDWTSEEIFELGKLHAIKSITDEIKRVEDAGEELSDELKEQVKQMRKNIN